MCNARPRATCVPPATARTVGAAVGVAVGGGEVAQPARRASVRIEKRRILMSLKITGDQP